MVYLESEMGNQSDMRSFQEKGLIKVTQEDKHGDDIVVDT